MKGPKQNRRTNGKLAKIPMPLFSGETMDDYEHELGRWLHHRQPSVLSLRFKPLKERLYRHQFANQRVLNRTASVSAKELHTQETRPQSLLPKAKSDVQEANEPTGSRDQAKHNATKATSSTELAAKTSLSQKIPEIKAAERTSHQSSCALSQTRTNKSDQVPNVSHHSPNTPTLVPPARCQKDIQDKPRQRRQSQKRKTLCMHRMQ